MRKLRFTLAIATALSLVVFLIALAAGDPGTSPFKEFLLECLYRCGRKRLALGEAILFTLMFDLYIFHALRDEDEPPYVESILRQLTRLGLASVTAVLAVKVWYVLLEGDHQLHGLELFAMIALSLVFLGNAYFIFVTPFRKELFQPFSWKRFWTQALANFWPS